MDTSEVMKKGIIADKYAIIELMARGGMSVLYKARHEPVGRVVAVKMLHSRLLDSPTTIKRFQQEARAASTLSHPNLITVFDYGVLDGGIPYLVMDFIEGRSLSEILDDEASLEPSRAIPIFLQTTQALAHAHEKGVLHRDMKPSNIMITNENGNEVVKIVDFGIAKFLPESGQESTKITMTGDFCGSVAYMSPEHCKALPLDKRSDVYSMGCVMYETLMGLPPFLSENHLDTMRGHVAGQAKPFKQQREDLNIPARLEKIVFKALEKDPGRRHASMDELSEELRSFMDAPQSDHEESALAAEPDGKQPQQSNEATRAKGPQKLQDLMTFFKGKPKT